MKQDNINTTKLISQVRTMNKVTLGEINTTNKHKLALSSKRPKDPVEQQETYNHDIKLSDVPDY